MLMVCACSPNV
ncbi:putative transposase, partial [Escherichia coli 8.0586]